ncbi:hypothetical protein ACP275_08G216700 [Erythranthe tilingii]
MELVRVLRMNGDLRGTSYANNSLVQRRVILLTSPIREEAISELYSSSSSSINGKLCVAELGCSSGPNALFVATEIVKTVHKICQKYGYSLPEFQIQLNDLPGNDFNSIFQSSLPSFQAELLPVLQEVGCPNQCFVSGVPGSFYSRLFAAKTLHFVHSSYSLMWLSKVPQGLEKNKENIYMASKSPVQVINAYYEQFQIDFSTFLRCRSVEVVSGGRMVLTILGRKTEDAVSTKKYCYIWDLMALSLQHMVSEGVIEKEKLESFNIPQYTPSPEEVKNEVEKEGSFTVSRLESSEITWVACWPEPEPNNNDAGDYLAQCMRSVTEPLLVNHFGQLVIDQLFQIYSQILSQHISDEDAKFSNVTVSLTRRSEQVPS